MLQKTNYDMVIADFKISGTDGLELLKKFQESVPSTIAILISAFTTESTVMEAEKQGIYYVAKPFEIDSLVKRLGELFEERARL
jgi:DNA-binding NtrC family response regulator